jgi:hypothetical protein
MPALLLICKVLPADPTFGPLIVACQDLVRKLRDPYRPSGTTCAGRTPSGTLSMAPGQAARPAPSQSHIARLFFRGRAKPDAHQAARGDASSGGVPSLMPRRSISRSAGVSS